MRERLCSLLVLAFSAAMAGAQPCMPELVEVGGTAPCGAFGRVDALAVHEREGVPRLFALVRGQVLDASEQIRPSGVMMWTPQGWRTFGDYGGWSGAEFRRNSAMLAVPRGDREPRLYVVGYPQPNNDWESYSFRWMDDSSSGWRGGNLPDVIVKRLETRPALADWTRTEWSTVLVGGSFRYYGIPPLDGLVMECQTTTCELMLGPLGGLASSNIRAFAYHQGSDGSPAALYAGGVDLDAAGSNLARLEGDEWQQVPLGIEGPIVGLQSHAGSLWVTTPQGLHRYDGGALHTLPPLLNVECIAWFDDGTGEHLYAGGSFTLSPGGAASQVVMFDGEEWQPVGPGFSDSEVEPAVKSLVVFDFGEGPRLVAGGHFHRVGIKLLNHLAAWDGQTWRALGNSDHLFGATYHDDGHGAEVHMLGISRRDVWYQPWDRVMRLRGGELEILGDDFPLGTRVNRIYSFDLGAGPQLYAVGNFNSAPGGVPALGVARWDGERWHGLGEPVAGSSADVRGAAVYDEDGPGPLPRSLYVTGEFAAMGATAALNVARWDGQAWHAVGEGLDSWGGQIAARVGRGVNELVVIKHHLNPQVGGQLATWNGQQWTFAAGSYPGSHVDGNLVSVLDTAPGPELYAVFPFFEFRKWNGATWTTLPRYPQRSIESVASFDDGSGPSVYVSGGLGSGGQGGFARWNGSSYELLYESESPLRNITASFDGCRSGILITRSYGPTGAVFYRGCGGCGSSDYNGDGDFGTDADIIDFFACLAGNCCAECGTADFNNDGDFGTDADIEAFFRVLAGQPC